MSARKVSKESQLEHSVIPRSMYRGALCCRGLLHRVRMAFHILYVRVLLAPCVRFNWPIKVAGTQPHEVVLPVRRELPLVTHCTPHLHTQSHRENPLAYPANACTCRFPYVCPVKSSRLLMVSTLRIYLFAYHSITLRSTLHQTAPAKQYRHPPRCTVSRHGQLLRRSASAC